MIVLLCLASCEAVSEPDPGSLAQRITAVRERMHVRFAAAKVVEAALVSGDLDRARAEARRIAQVDEHDVLPEWRPYFDELRVAAEQVAAAGDAITAAQAVARVGRSCGRCHEAIGAKIVFARELKPSDDARLATQMASHQWATARMWEGLIGPTSDHWLEGARTLARARMTVAAEVGTLGIADDAARARLLAERALKAGTADARAALYGDLLATCAHCHATIRDR